MSWPPTISLLLDKAVLYVGEHVGLSYAYDWNPPPAVGGVLEIFLFCFVAGVTAHFIGASVHEGIFVGALVSPQPSMALRSNA